MIVEYNEEIYAWAEVFEKDRYEKDAKGSFKIDERNSFIPNADFLKVEKRFNELNIRMTKMVLASIPQSENLQEKNHNEQRPN